MRPFSIAGAFLLGSSCLGWVPSASAQSTSGIAVCETTYDGPPGGSDDDSDNWSNGLPRPGWVACYPDRAGTAAVFAAFVRSLACRCGQMERNGFGITSHPFWKGRPASSGVRQVSGPRIGYWVGLRSG